MTNVNCMIEVSFYLDYILFTILQVRLLKHR